MRTYHQELPVIMDDLFYTIATVFFMVIGINMVWHWRDLRSKTPRFMDFESGGQRSPQSSPTPPRQPEPPAEAERGSPDS